jgi:hypothetical protein
VAEEPTASHAIADPRVIKRARHSYTVKRPGDHGSRHTGPAMIKLVNLDLPALAA